MGLLNHEISRVTVVLVMVWICTSAQEASMDFVRTVVVFIMSSIALEDSRARPYWATFPISLACFTFTWEGSLSRTRQWSRGKMEVRFEGCYHGGMNPLEGEHWCHVQPLDGDEQIEVIQLAILCGSLEVLRS